jgi:hypothetical protein
MLPFHSQRPNKRTNREGREFAVAFEDGFPYSTRPEGLAYVVPVRILFAM